MRHVRLTCQNHPELRWMCKSIAVNHKGQYNGQRSIFFLGKMVDGEPEGVVAGAIVWECYCPPSDLRFAPEELERQKTEPLED